jgi:Nucleotidyltransferase of unknown function (DUF6036)
MLNRLLDVFKCLKTHNVKYLVIGGIAAILYGVPRATFDLDILIEPTPKNVKNLLEAFLEAGLGTASLTSIDDLLANEITIFKDRIRIDVQTSTPGIQFERAWQNKKVMQYQNNDFYVVSKSDLIASKKAAGWNVDLEDVKLLQLKKQ